MNVGRIFTSAIARRIAYVVVAALCAWAGVGTARAQSPMYDSQGAAYSACMANLQWQRQNEPGAGIRSGSCQTVEVYSATVSNYFCLVTASGGYGCRGVKGYYFRTADSCAKTPSKTTSFLPVSGSTGCNLGCTVKYSQNADETSTVSTTGSVCTDDELKKNCPAGSYWNGYMGVCEPVDKPCPAGQKKQDGQCVPDGKCPDGMISVQGTTPGAVQQGSLYCKPAENECPAGNVKSPTGQCLPGDGQCASGEARGKDGTCKKDANNDGKPDEEEGDQDPNKDSASGGDSCDSPPSCSGNAIACMQVKIQWRIDCNTRRQVNINGGTCDAVPICTGKGCNAMEYAQLMQQWRTSCAVEKLAGKTGETAGPVGDANKNGVADVLEGTGNVSDPGDGKADVDGAKRFGIGVSTDRLNKENIFGSGSCPEPPSFQIMGFSISNDFPYWCQAMAILRALVLMFGAFVALKILMGGVI